MYYNYNVKYLGEKTVIVYANKYINWLLLGSRYADQKTINNLCPSFVKNVEVVPDFFKNMINNID